MTAAVKLLARHVPVDKLRSALRSRQIFADDDADSWALAQEALRRLGSTEVWALVDDVLTFGRGSLWWFPSDEIEPARLGVRLRETLGFNPFRQEPRLAPQEQPQIATGYLRPSGKALLLTMIGRERAIPTVDGVERHVEALYTPMIVRPGARIVEVWASRDMARAANGALQAALGQALQPPIRLDDEQVQQLIRVLNATLVQQKLRDDTGQGVESIELKKTLDARDLRRTARYRAGDFNQLPRLRDIIEFEAPGGLRVTMAVAWNGAFLFRRFVPETVVDYVLSQVEGVLGRPTGQPAGRRPRRSPRSGSRRR